MIDTTGTLNPEIEDLLKKLTHDFGFEPTPDVMLEILHELPSLYSELKESNRDYAESFVVVEIRGKFIGYTWATVHGDNSLYDIGWTFNWGSVVFCEPYVYMETRYRPIGDE